MIKRVHPIPRKKSPITKNANRTMTSLLGILTIVCNKREIANPQAILISICE